MNTIRALLYCVAEGLRIYRHDARKRNIVSDLPWTRTIVTGLVAFTLGCYILVALDGTRVLVVALVALVTVWTLLTAAAIGVCICGLLKWTVGRALARRRARRRRGHVDLRTPPTARPEP